MSKSGWRHIWENWEPHKSFRMFCNQVIEQSSTKLTNSTRTLQICDCSTPYHLFSLKTVLSVLWQPEISRGSGGIKLKSETNAQIRHCHVVRRHRHETMKYGALASSGSFSLECVSLDSSKRSSILLFQTVWHHVLQSIKYTPSRGFGKVFRGGTGPYPPSKRCRWR